MKTKLNFRKLITNLLIVLLVLTASFELNAQETVFHGKINGIDDTKISIIIISLNEKKAAVFDTISCVKGEFSYRPKLDLDKWYLVRLNSNTFDNMLGYEKSCLHRLKNREIVFFIQAYDNLSIVANIEQYGINYQVTGNQIASQSNAFKHKIYPLEKKYNQFIISDQLEELSSIRGKIHKVQLEMIAQHPDWLYSAMLLPNFPIDTISKYFNNFTPQVRESFFGKYASEFLIAPTGSQAPTFTLRNNKRRCVSLDDFAGQYIVLNFWGSWCEHCACDLPKMKEYHNKYKDQISFLSIDCRDSKKDWKNALSKYKINFINLYDKDNKIAKKYGVHRYPTKVIIDKEGNIISKTIGETADFYNKLDELFNK